MGAFVIEYVGKEGVKTSPANAYRMGRPRSGDLIRWHDGSLGRAWGNPGEVFAEDDQIHVCESLGSAFLSPDGSVDISGGPFRVLDLSDLEPAYELGRATVWNWGDNYRGAGQGVDYEIQRPIFNYVGNNHDISARPRKWDGPGRFKKDAATT